VHQVTPSFPEIAVNRIGTHPVENIFGPMRVAANGNHSWDRCKKAITKASLMDEILFAHKLKSHVRRDFTIAGIKLWQDGGREILQMSGFEDRGMTYAEGY
jgi:hypothetical protein